jgi:hypothetical protein
MKGCWATLCALLWMQAASAQILVVESGSVSFFSKAPKELIEARSADLKGGVDATKGTFFFKVGIASFKGFNSPLQQQHFNENYMESSAHPHATYNGKIIDALDLSKEGTYPVRTKGKFTVHGVTVERIVPATVTVKGGKATLRSEFTVPLIDHRIKIPRVVYDKLAPEIAVTVAAILVPRS